MTLRFGPTTNLAVADTPQIGLGAAAESIDTTVSSHTSATGNFGLESTWLVYTTSVKPISHVITATLSMDVWTTSPTARSVELWIVEDGGAAGPWLSSTRNIVATATPGERVHFQVNAPATAGKFYYVRAVLGCPGGGSTGVVEVRNASLRVEHIKR
jgi:hypothetical protein